MRYRTLPLFFALLSAPAWAQNNPTPQTLVLDFRDNVTAAEVKAFEADYRISTRLNSIYSDTEELRISQTLSAEQATSLLARMANDPRLEHAELQQWYSLPDDVAGPAPLRDDKPVKDFPNDPKYKHQWHLDQIHMPKAWKENSGEGVVVAVIDTGVAYEEYQQFQKIPDLAETCFVAGYDFVNDSAHANDDHGHGTHVAGTIAQSTHNGIGVAGIAHKACIMPIKVLSKQGGGTTADIADGIRFAADNGAKVINMSLGGPFPSATMSDAVEYAYNKGVVVIAAAGNNGWKKVGYPAAYEHVIAVSATDIEDNLTFYSNYGADIDIAAPGGDTRHDKNNDGIADGVLQNTIATGDPTKNDYFPYMGTSMASPHVAGVAALIIAAGVTEPKAVGKILFESADRTPAEKNGAKKGQAWDEKYGYGRLDAAKALELASFRPDLYQSMLAFFAAALLVASLRRRQLISQSPGLLFGASLLTASSGLLFFAPMLSIPLGPVAPFLTQGLASWDTALLGVHWHGNLLFFSAAFPLLALGLFSQGRRGRQLTAGLALGFAVHLGYAALFRGFDMQLLPGSFLDTLWLSVNALLCVGIASVSLREK